MFQGKGKVETYWLTHTRNLRSSVTTRDNVEGYLRRGSILACQRVGSQRRSLRGRLSPGMPRHLTLADDQELRQEYHSHENPLHCKIMMEDTRFSPPINHRESRNSGTTQERQGLMSTIATTKL